MGTIVMTTQLIAGLSLLVFVHELGHFLAAKAFGMRVNKFYIFFDAWGKKIWSKQIGGTEYGIGWLPLGGYVQIAGMIDETQDAKDLSPEPEEWEFRAKPAWQRFIVMIGGIVMNVITGILIFAMYLHVFKAEYLPATELNKHGVYAHELAQGLGVETGDKILAVNGNLPERYSEIVSTNLYLGTSVTVEHKNGQTETIQLPEDFHKNIGPPRQLFISPMYEDVSVVAVAPGSGADKAGLKAKDEIKEVAGEEIKNFPILQEVLKRHKEDTVEVKVNRAGEMVVLEARVDTGGRLGFQPKFEVSKDKYGFAPYDWGKAFKYSYREGYDLIAAQVVSFGLLFTGQLPVTKSLASPIGIAKIYGPVWDWDRFWFLTGLLSFVLAFMNILPIPALDGGHMVFLLFEMITGRALSDEFLERANIVGILLIMGLMFFAFGLDIYKIIFNLFP